MRITYYVLRGAGRRPKPGSGAHPPARRSFGETGWAPYHRGLAAHLHIPERLASRMLLRLVFNTAALRKLWGGAAAPPYQD